MAFLGHALDRFFELHPPIVWKSHWTVNMMPNKSEILEQSLSHTVSQALSV